MAYLKTAQFDAALLDTGYPNVRRGTADKALFRAAEALYQAQKFTASRDVLKLIPESSPSYTQAIEVLVRVGKRIEEQNTGIYNFKHFQEQAQKPPVPHLDFATFLGPVEIRQTPSKGRGLYVTRAVKAGDLLLCEKAFCHSSEGKDGSNISLTFQSDIGRPTMSTQGSLIRDVAQKLLRNPSTASEFTSLHHGSYEPVSTRTVDGQPVVDT